MSIGRLAAGHRRRSRHAAIPDADELGPVGARDARIIGLMSATDAMTALRPGSFLDTMFMVGVSAGIAVLAGIPLALFLVTSGPGRHLPGAAGATASSATVVNGFRAVPFIVLLVALIPFTRLVAGTTIGVWAAIVPLSISATPFFARIAEVSLREVDAGLIEAAQSIGCRRWHIVAPRAAARGAAGHRRRLHHHHGRDDRRLRHGRRGRRGRARRHGHPLRLPALRHHRDGRGASRC